MDKHQNLNYIGKPLERKDAWDKVTGKAQYLDDCALPDMLYAKLVMSDQVHARITEIETTEASNFPGVKKVIIAGDVPDNEIGVVINDQPLLACDHVRYHGEPVAMIVADSKRSAAQAAKLVKIKSEPLPVLLDPVSAKSSTEIKIHPNGNVNTHYLIRNGNPDQMFSESDLIIERRFNINYQEHLYLETQGVIADWKSSGDIEIYATCQCPFYIKGSVAKALRIPLNRVRVIQTVTGGGFGGKEDVPSEYAARAAVASYLLKKPVKLVLERNEDLILTSKRHPAVMDYRAGFSKSGKLLAMNAKVYADSGAYSTLTPIVLFRTCVHATGPYELENLSVDIFGVYTNKMPCGAFRGFGTPQVIFAVESIFNEAAQKLNLDPIKLRKQNALKVGSKTATGQILTESVGYIECLEAIENSLASNKFSENSPAKPNQKTGIGIAGCFYGVSLGTMGWHLDRAASHVIINPDGSVNFNVGNTEMGQGALTVLSQIVAENLGCPYQNISPGLVDTKLIPDSGPTVASRTTVMSGNSLADACRKLNRRIREFAAELWNVKPDLIKTGADGFHTDSHQISFQEIVNQADRCNVKLIESGWYVAPQTNWDKETGLGDAYYVYSYAVHAAKVTVDTETGEVTPEALICAQDVGKAINPQLCEGQVEGGSVQGMGLALYENFQHDDQGRVMSTGLQTYIIPTILDTPKTIETILIEQSSKDGPFGAKGLGEPSLMPAPAAFAAAVSAAISQPVTKIPVTSEYILQLINSKDKKEN